MLAARHLSVLLAALAVACDEGREQPPFTPSGSRDGGASAGTDGGLPALGDGGPGATDAGGASPDGGAVPPAPEVDPRCLDGMYSEPLPSAGASLASLVSSYSAANVVTFVEGALELRYPTGAYLVAGALMDVSGGNCVDIFLSDKSSANAVLRQLSTVVHECGHFYDHASGGAYHITAGNELSCSRGDTVARGGRTFARSLITRDGFSSMRPPCNGQQQRGCDFYADIYLDGDPDDGTFDSGDQGFNMLLEETVQYVNSLATGYAFADQLPRGSSVSERDGILTFLWYVERYLRMARLEQPSAYAFLTGDACWREAILTVWGRAWLMLAATESQQGLGIEDDALIALVRDPELLGEIARLRQAAGCP